jgi:predicted ester cyclase
MIAEQTQDVIEAYLHSEHTDVSLLAEDVVFTNMASLDETRGPQAVLGMLTYFYRIAFNATFEQTNAIYAADQAVLEGYFVGKHTGEFAGIPATGREVRVPMCIVYELGGGKITKARIYFEIPVLMNQLSAPA